MIKIIGALLLALPFSLLAIIMCKNIGWKVTLCVWTVSLILTALIFTGVYLLCK